MRHDRTQLEECVWNHPPTHGISFAANDRPGVGLLPNETAYEPVPRPAPPAERDSDRNTSRSSP